MNKRHLLLLALLTGGCTPTRVNDSVPLAVPKEWHHRSAAQTVSADLKTWWTSFRDPLLNELITEALAANQDLQIAKARIREAAAMVTVAESALYPGIELFTSGGREKRIERIVGVPGNQGIELKAPTADMVSGGLAARWEIDLFGGRHLEAEAASAQAQGSEEALRAVQVGLLAQVATHYLELRGIQKRIVILMKSIDLQREQFRALQVFNRNGLADSAAVAGRETLLHNAQASLPILKMSEATLIHRLGVLSGKPPEKLENRLLHALDQAPVMPDIPQLLPSTLLLQRPDLRLAQTGVSVAAASLGAARADLFPKLILSASGGLGALAAGGFPSLAESVYTLGSGLSAPIFTAGRIRAQINAADARLDQAAANYEKTFLLALEDVENAFVAHTASQERHKQLSEAEMAADKAYRRIEVLYRHGAKDYLSVLDSQHNKLAIEDERTQTEAALQVSIVSLYRAFGGGWTNEQAP
ncbi:TolC family protein [Methylobacter sp.]|uniref:TolC family protein n=1 Tax=Methylobacter sp. TaxID=2051955 RepID=UPI002FDE866D